MIEKSITSKNLGVTFDEAVNMKSHINSVYKSLYYHCIINTLEGIYGAPCVH